MLPDGGINGNKGLKNKSIVIEGLLNEVVKVVWIFELIVDHY